MGGRVAEVGSIPARTWRADPHIVLTGSIRLRDGLSNLAKEQLALDHAAAKSNFVPF